MKTAYTHCCHCRAIDGEPVRNCNDQCRLLRRAGRYRGPPARTVVIGPNTGSMNVNRGEIVKIVVNGQEFAWGFDGTLPALNLKQIAPQISLTFVRVPFTPLSSERALGYIHIYTGSLAGSVPFEGAPRKSLSLHATTSTISPLFHVHRAVSLKT